MNYILATLLFAWPMLTTAQLVVNTPQKPLQTSNQYHSLNRKLANLYQAGLTVSGKTALKRVYLTPRTIQHVFDISLKASDGFNRLTGLHSAEALREHPTFYWDYKKSGPILESIIAPTPNSLPVYKTIFSFSISHEKIIQYLQEALHNIIVEKSSTQPLNPAKFFLQGLTKDGTIIEVLIDGNSHILTFYPIVAQKKRPHTDQLTKFFKDHFLHQKNSILRPPLTLNNAQKLYQQHFSQPLTFKKSIITQPNGSFLVPTDSLKYSAPVSFTTVQFTPQLIAKLFSEKNNVYFPLNMEAQAILNAVREIIEKINNSPQPFPIVPFNGNSIAFQVHGPTAGYMDYRITLDKKNGSITNIAIISDVPPGIINWQ